MAMGGNHRYNPYGGGPPRGGPPGPGGYGGYGAGPGLDRGPHGGGYGGAHGGVPSGAYGAGASGGYGADRGPGGLAASAPGFGGPGAPQVGGPGVPQAGGLGVPQVGGPGVPQGAAGVFNGAPGYGAPVQHGPVHGLQVAGGPGGAGAAVQGAPGTTVRLRGIPFRAQIQDIHTFFMGYNFIPESCRIGADGTGRPSGDAWISFATVEEASRAVMQKNKQHLGSRYIELFQQD